jgi:hypothetical protein
MSHPSQIYITNIYHIYLIRYVSQLEGALKGSERQRRRAENEATSCCLPRIEYDHIGKVGVLIMVTVISGDQPARGAVQPGGAGAGM